jgi:hypothetical protein
MTIRESYTAICDCCGVKATAYAMNMDEAMKVFRHNLGWSLVVQQYTESDGKTSEKLLYAFCTPPCLSDYTEAMEDLSEGDLNDS